MSFCQRSTYAGRVTLLWFAGYVPGLRGFFEGSSRITKGKRSVQLQARECNREQDETKSRAKEWARKKITFAEDDGCRTKCRRKTVEVARRRTAGWKWVSWLI